MTEMRNKIICGDCIKILNKVRKPFADLIFADPPFNIGYKYDKYHDKLKAENYTNWSKEWMTACCDVLNPHGSFYIAIGDSHAADIKKIADKLGLTMRNWIIWHYTFGQQMKRKFARSHTHILYFVNDKSNFTFNDHLVRVISDRQKKYRDKRANSAGKMPDDVWDEYPRICGTFTERADFPCQMPESLLARIIRTSSNEGDWVLDPFSGSGTTAAAASRLKRLYTGIEISSDYVKQSRQRLCHTKRKAVRKSNSNEHVDDEIKWLHQENKVSYEQLINDRNLLDIFTEKLNARSADKIFKPIEVEEKLQFLQRAGKLAPITR